MQAGVSTRRALDGSLARSVLAVALVAVASTMAASSVSSAGATPSPSFPHVTGIGDSVLTAVRANPEPLTLLGRPE